VRWRDEQQRSAVGRRLGHCLGGNVAAGTGAVVDDQLLADAGGQAQASRRPPAVRAMSFASWPDFLPPAARPRKRDHGRVCRVESLGKHV